MQRIIIIFTLLTQFYFLSSTSGAVIISNKNKNIEKTTNSSYRAQTKQFSILHDVSTCKLSPSLIAEIKGYETIANRIISEATQNSFRGRTYKNLATFVDKFDHRLSGSKILEDSIDYILEKMKEYGLVNVHGEEAVVPHWVRGEEKAELVEPRIKNIPILGLGTTVGTSPDGITAEVWVVRSFEELRADPSRAIGKIIVYNQIYTNYGESVRYRSLGSREAGKVGAVAALIRSIAPISLDTPHTGTQDYDPDVVNIPVACITIEDSELLYRMQLSGEKISIHLTMLDYNLPLTTSRNVIGEIKGREKPDEVVIVSGHIDSWDVGQGAMDDGGGCFISIESLALLQSLKLVPRRTLRAILWTAEEIGLYYWGSRDYVRHHMDEMNKIIAAFESDGGTFTPKGLDFAGSEEAGCIVYEVLKLLAPLHATEYNMYDSVSTDISDLIDQGVPGLSLNNADDRYFWYHHTEADTMSMMDPVQLDQGTAVWAVAAYIIADLSVPLPRKLTTRT